MESGRDTLGKVQAIALIVSAIAVPILISIFGWIIQSKISNQTLAKDYVQIAVKVLQENRDQKDDELKKWATSIVDENSPIPITAGAREEREREGKLVLLFMPVPPDILMKAPKPPDLLPTDKSVTQREFVVNVLENYGICNENELTLKYLQKWVRDMLSKYNEQNQKIGITGSEQ